MKSVICGFCYPDTFDQHEQPFNKALGLDHDIGKHRQNNSTLATIDDFKPGHPSWRFLLTALVTNVFLANFTTSRAFGLNGHGFLNSCLTCCRRCSKPTPPQIAVLSLCLKPTGLATQPHGQFKARSPKRSTGPNSKNPTPVRRASQTNPTDSRTQDRNI